MKYLRQLLLILSISFAGEVLKYFLPFPIPASIYGMVILFIGLLTGRIRLEAVKETGKFLIEIMPVMFIPAGNLKTGACTGKHHYRGGAGDSDGGYGQNFPAADSEREREELLRKALPDTVCRRCGRGENRYEGVI